jgi:hypothetical protein
VGGGEREGERGGREGGERVVKDICISGYGVAVLVVTVSYTGGSNLFLSNAAKTDPRINV